jgi:hypothetical protein
VIAVVSIVILMYCVVNGTKILNIFNPEGEGVMQSYQEKPPGSLTGVILDPNANHDASATTVQQPSETGKKGENQQIIVVNNEKT